VCVFTTGCDGQPQTSGLARGLYIQTAERVFWQLGQKQTYAAHVRMPLRARSGRSPIQPVAGSTTIWPTALGSADLVLMSEGPINVAPGTGNRSCFRARLTVWLEIVCLIVAVGEKLQGVSGATCCATARMLATLTTYGSEYKVTIFALITAPHRERLMS